MYREEEKCVTIARDRTAAEEITEMVNKVLKKVVSLDDHIHGKLASIMNPVSAAPVMVGADSERTFPPFFQDIRCMLQQIDARVSSVNEAVSRVDV